MDTEEMFEVLRTCIIGESFRACGVGYHPEDALEAYHASEFLDNIDEDDITGSFHSPEHFLENMCSSNAGRVYDTIREMDDLWKSGLPGSLSRSSAETMKLLWDLGNVEALQYIDDNFGQLVAQEFLEYGSSLFDCSTK
ncbi:unnamed protein product [Ectocarpus sp. 6 AP-2014]